MRPQPCFFGAIDKVQGVDRNAADFPGHISRNGALIFINRSPTPPLHLWKSTRAIYCYLGQVSAAGHGGAPSLSTASALFFAENCGRLAHLSGLRWSASPGLRAITLEFPVASSDSQLELTLARCIRGYGAKCASMPGPVCVSSFFQLRLAAAFPYRHN